MMYNRRMVAVLALAGLFLVGGTPWAPVAPSQALVPGTLVDLELVADGLDDPLLVTHAGDGTGRIFVAEQPGRIHVIDGGTTSPYLDITAKVGDSGFEQGLLGLAFSPDFATSGRLYVSYTDGSGDSVLERLTIPGDPLADTPPQDGAVLLTVDQPFANHNGGNIAFGPDGMLYFGLGDGGSSNDPGDRAQDLGTLLGKMLRIDVSGAGYTIPADNPFVGEAGARPEIWAYGLRNPWRWSFDRATGDLWIGDVGQNLVEEVNLQPAASAGGENYGWRAWEGHLPLGPNDPFQFLDVPATEVTFPVSEYSHGEGIAVTGGHVYRGPSIPAIDGRYVFGDYGTGTIWMLTETAPGVYARSHLMQTTFLLGLSSFGEDEAGRLYVTNLAGGEVWRFVPSLA